MKDVGVAYILLILAGFIGAHKFYLGKPIIGILYFLTAGFVGLGCLYDLFTLSSQVAKINTAIEGGYEQ